MPHSSVLGPLLFTVFINHLEREVSIEVAKFADDKLFRLHNSSSTSASAYCPINVHFPPYPATTSVTIHHGNKGAHKCMQDDSLMEETLCPIHV